MECWHNRIKWGVCLGTALPVLACVSLAASDAKQISEKSQSARSDQYGNPLPEGAISRMGAVRRRQQSAAWSLVFSVDGATVFSVGAQTSKICTWEAATGRLVRETPCPDDGAKCVARSPDGQTLATVWSDISILDVGTGKVLQRLASVQGPHTCAAFSPDGKTLASASFSGVRLWDVSTGKLKSHFPNWGHVWSLSYSPDGKKLAGAGGHAAHLGDTVSGQAIWSVHLGEAYRNYAAAFAPDGSTIAADDANGDVIILEASSGKELRRLRGHKGPVSALAFSTDGKLLASGGQNDATIRLWDTTNGNQANCLLLSSRWRIMALAFSPDGKTLASGGDGYQIVQFWNVAEGKGRTPPFIGHRDFVTAVSFAADGKSLAAGDLSGGLFHWNAATGERIGEFAGNLEPIQAVAFTPDCQRLVSACWGSGVRLWDVKAQKELLGFEGPTNRIHAVAISPDAAMVATASIQSLVRLWDAASGLEIREIQGSAGWTDIGCLTFSPDGRLLALGSRNGGICLCDVKSGKEMLRMAGHGGVGPKNSLPVPSPEQRSLSVNSIAISPDGHWLASGGGDGTVRIWDLTTGEELRGGACQHGGVICVAFAPDGRTIVSGDQGSNVYLWEVATAEAIRVFKGHGDIVNCVAFAPDGRSVASGSKDLTVVTWDVTGWMGAPAAAPVLAADMEKLWGRLAHPDVAAAHRALWDMVASPTSCVALLRERVRAVEVVPQARLAALVTNLDSNRFAAREEAARELEKLGEVAVPALKAALAQRPSLELKTRAERLLSLIDTPAPPPQRLRLGRALAILEQIGSEAAREVLLRLAAGAEDAWLTLEARASVQRLAKRR
jgi:WD40 repeat protein